MSRKKNGKVLFKKFTCMTSSSMDRTKEYEQLEEVELKQMVFFNLPYTSSI